MGIRHPVYHNGGRKFHGKTGRKEIGDNDRTRGEGLGEYRAYLAQKQMFRSTEKEMSSKMQIPHNLHYVVNQKSGCICSKCPGDTICTGTVLCKN